MEGETKERKGVVKTVFKTICIVGLIVGIMLWASAKTTEEYDVSDFRSSRGARYAQKTEDLLKDNETCKIEGNKIIVTEQNEALYLSGMWITLFFGVVDGIWFWHYLEDRRLTGKDD